MPLTSIVTIVLRLFSVSWFLQGFFLLSSALRDVARFWGLSGNYWMLVPPTVFLVGAIFLFMWSKLLARMVTPHLNPEVAISSLTQYDLYCFAFTFLGLYFALSSIADTLNWLHYFLSTMRDTHEGNPQRADAFYDLSRPLITLFAGGACLLFAPRCARKLTDSQRKHDNA